mgnify:CR=1 FL=1
MQPAEEQEDQTPGEEPDKNPIKLYRGFHKASYTFEQVISDLIDNSIDANANFVEVIIDTQNLSEDRKEHRYLDGEDNLYCIVLDDGDGILESNLRSILSRGFDRDYDETELGSYGVGLKDSSLSQAYELTIFSKTLENPEIAMRRLSSCLVKRHQVERIFRESDLDEWMVNTPAYLESLRLLNELEKGTVILLEGMHKLELKIGNGERDVYTNAIDTRVKNYLRLVFQYYLQGTNVYRVDGSYVHKQIDIFYNGREEFNKLSPLDPFYRDEEYMNGTREGTNFIEKHFDTNIEGEENPRQMIVRAWVLPHRSVFTGVGRRETQLSKTKEGKMGDDGTVGGVGVVDLQGAYIYRNKRLVQFAPDRDPWLGMMTKNERHNQMRIEIHCPPGKDIGGDKSDFDLNTSKSTVGIDYSLIEELRTWAADPGETFHADDPAILDFQARVTMRNRRDAWPTCGHCGSEEHKIAQCPTRPRCPICNSVTHTEVRDCPRRPACEICGDRNHITADHIDEPREEVVDGRNGEDEQPIEQPTSVSIRHSTDGDLISTIQEGTDLIIRLNIHDPLYANLRTALDQLEE